MTNVTIKNNSTKQEEPAHKVGNWYHLRDAYNDSIAVITIIDAHAYLVCTDGEYWEDSPVIPDDLHNIEEQEFTKLCGKGAEYKMLKNITITVE